MEAAMEPVTDIVWDIIICGTGLQQSMLALALSRTGKKILHIDPNEYYGGAEASMSMQEVQAWAVRHAEASATSTFSAASVWREQGVAASKLGPSRFYALSLAPQILHSASRLVKELVSSQAYRHLEFLAVSSFFVLEAVAVSPSVVTQSLVRIPATREDVFVTTSLGPREKRKLMKFFKAVLAYGGDEDTGPDEDAGPDGDSSSNTSDWQSQATAPFGEFLQREIGLDGRLCDYVLALTLSLDGASTTVGDALARLYRHISSMGAFGPGFAAVYPKWGGCSEIAQVACRAGAVGGAVYMLGAGVVKMEPKDEGVELELTTNQRVRAKMFVDGPAELGSAPATSAGAATQRLSRMVAVIGVPLTFLFESVVEGAPVAGGAVLVIPAGRPVLTDGSVSPHPIYVMAHSGDTGECPTGQCVLYLTTVHTHSAKAVLDKALEALLVALSNASSQASAVPQPQSLPCLFRLYYEQARSRKEPTTHQGPVFRFPPLFTDLVVPDASLDDVQAAWAYLGGDTGGDPYMVFSERKQSEADEDDPYGYY